jgi:hypothetical protein
MNWPLVQLTLRRMMAAIVVIALLVATMTWLIRLNNDFDQMLRNFYGPQGTLHREPDNTPSDRF